MDTPIFVAQAEHLAMQRWQAVRAASHRRKLAVALVAVGASSAYIWTRKPSAPVPETLQLPPEPEIVLHVHTYASSAPETLAAVPAEPPMDFEAVSDSCSTELGLLCHAVAKDPVPAVHCLREHVEAVRPTCRHLLQLQPELASAP